MKDWCDWMINPMVLVNPIILGPLQIDLFASPAYPFITAGYHTQKSMLLLRIELRQGCLPTSLVFDSSVHA